MTDIHNAYILKATNFRTLDLNLLRVFDAVVAEGSLTRAAEGLAMTQPAVSNALKRLRAALGEDLLTRTAHGMRPTPFGQQLAQEVRAALGSLRAALDPQIYDPAVDTADFSIAMADATAAVLLPPLMARLQAQNARAHLRVLPLLTRDPLNLLERGDADMAIGHFPDAMAGVQAQGEQSSVLHERLTESRYRCAMRHGHPLADGELTLDSYCAARHVLVSFSGRGHGFVDQALAGLGRRRDVVLTVNQFFTAARVVAQTDLLTVLPSRYLATAVRGENLVGRELPLAPGGVHVDALWHRRSDNSAPHRWLRAELRAVAGQLGPADAA